MAKISHRTYRLPKQRQLPVRSTALPWFGGTPVVGNVQFTVLCLTRGKSDLIWG